MGTSRPEIEVVREQPASSEESKSIVNIAGKPADQADNLNRDQVNNQDEAENQDAQLQLEMVMTLTQTINSLGGKFEQMGQSFEEKLAQIEARHRDLETKLAEVKDIDAQ